jgi:hypothetical protein
MEMEAVRRRRFVIPKGIFEYLEEHPRIIIEPAPGFWPIDIAILRQSNILEKLAADKEFNKNFEIVIMPK